MWEKGERQTNLLGLHLAIMGGFHGLFTRSTHVILRTRRSRGSQTIHPAQSPVIFLFITRDVQLEIYLAVTGLCSW